LEQPSEGCLPPAGPSKLQLSGAGSAKLLAAAEAAAEPVPVWLIKHSSTADQAAEMQQQQEEEGEEGEEGEEEEEQRRVDADGGLPKQAAPGAAAAPLGVARISSEQSAGEFLDSWLLPGAPHVLQQEEEEPRQGAAAGAPRRRRSSSGGGGPGSGLGWAGPSSAAPCGPRGESGSPCAAPRHMTTLLPLLAPLTAGVTLGSLAAGAAAGGPGRGGGALAAPGRRKSAALALELPAFAASGPASPAEVRYLELVFRLQQLLPGLRQLGPEVQALVSRGPPPNAPPRSPAAQLPRCHARAALHAACRPCECRAAKGGARPARRRASPLTRPPRPAPPRPPRPPPAGL
jgi:hypothetical protein